MINAAFVKELLDLQRATNVAYFGEDWANHWKTVSSTNAIYREWAEFLDEVTMDWKNYGGKGVWNQVDAIYEAVDVVHFMLCSLLTEWSRGELEGQMEDMVEWKLPEKVVSLEYVTWAFSNFMFDKTVQRLVIFITAVCSYLAIDVDLYMKAHKRKNDRNRLRAVGGASYDKSKETPLTLEF